VNRHAFVAAHGDNITLQVTRLRRVTTLIDRERTQAMLAGVSVGLCDDPSRRVTDTEIQDLTLADQRVEGLHQLRDLGSEVPGMNVVLCWVSLHHGDCGAGLCSY